MDRWMDGQMEKVAVQMENRIAFLNIIIHFSLLYMHIFPILLAEDSVSDSAKQLEDKKLYKDVLAFYNFE